ncbi:MAG: hypothetical protein KJN62_07880, partial [Deltaproteobacteria bacterium]|nr:hypothetical protein [Deltaproteobacteria bacterium]
MPQDNYNECVKMLSEAQESEKDNREKVREADHFINHRQGQWEAFVLAELKSSGRPRYTFDECGPIIDDIMGEMETMEFDIRVNPAGSDASKDTARIYEGIIRNIENISNARHVYNASARIMVGTGFDAWRVIYDFVDGDSFDQDLLIRKIPNAQDSVWFDPGATEQNMDDADYCYVLSSITMREYKKRYPKGSEVSVGTDRDSEVYYYKKPDEIVVGEYIWRQQKERELALMSNGAVYAIDDKFLMIKDELAAKDITIERTRTRKYYEVYQQTFDGKDWLKDKALTPFDCLPVVPVYGNFRISENKVIYYGVIEKIMDAQRVLNYSESRKIEEGALSPRGKYWMSKAQATSPDVRADLETLNVNAKAVQFYDYIEGHPPPQYQGAPQSNPGLVETSQSSQQFIMRTSGTFDESRGTAPAQRSGTAIGLLQQKSDNPKRKWFSSMEIALTKTCRILIKAIPKIYDTERQMRLVNEDGTTDEAMINQRVLDQQTKEYVDLNDLSKGTYDVTCTAGPAFHSRQQETVQAINEIAAIDPSIMQIGADIMLNNIASPGVDLIAERKRQQMVMQGMIPESQLTDEEKQVVAAQQQQQQPPDAMMVAAQAEMAKAQAKSQELALKAQIEQQKLQLEQVKMQLNGQLEAAKLEQNQQKQITENIKAMAQQVKNQAEALKMIREAMGAEAIIDEQTAQAYR